MSSILELLQQAQSALKKQHPDTANFEAKTLLKHCLNIQSSDLVTALNDPIHDTEKLQQFEHCLARRLNNEPLDLIIGNTVFRGNDYEVQKAVLLPRPETEILVEHVHSKIQALTLENPTIIELGFGTGVISIELAKAYPEATLHAWDISENAFKLAQRNKAMHAVNNLHLYHDDFFSSSAAWRKLESPFVFVSNPPYIPSEDIKGLDCAVTDYDPITALDGGPSGLDFYKRCFAELKGKCHFQAYELGIDQFKALNEEASNEGYRYECFADYHDIPRILILQDLY